MSKRIFFYFSAASGILREDLRTFYCFRRNKFDINVFNVVQHWIFYTVHRDF